MSDAVPERANDSEKICQTTSALARHLALPSDAALEAPTVGMAAKVTPTDTDEPPAVPPPARERVQSVPIPDGALSCCSQSRVNHR